MQAILGIFVFLLIAYAFSEDRKKVSFKIIFGALLLQFFLALLMFNVPFISEYIVKFNDLVLLLKKSSESGSRFLFGYLSGAPAPFEIKAPNNNFVLAFQVLPIVIFLSSLSSLLFHWKILPGLIFALSFVLKRFTGIGGLSSFSSAAAVFFGIIETPILVKPYLAKMNRSSLFTLLTACMATVAGTVMVLYATVLTEKIPDAASQILIASLISAPAAILFSKLIIPEDLENEEKILIPSSSQSSFEAIIDGANEGLKMLLQIVAVILVLFSFMYLINAGLGLFQDGLKLEDLFAYLFAPFCWLMGIPAAEMMAAGKMMATKTLLNEFVAYLALAQADQFSEKSQMILLYALCGFANFGSAGIVIGGVGSVIPDRKKELVGLTFKAMIAGTLATMTTGAVVSFFL